MKIVGYFAMCFPTCHELLRAKIYLMDRGTNWLSSQ